MSRSWTVDFDEILLVSDSLGNNNYTYRVQHPASTFDEFYNLVLTENIGKQLTTVKLVRYKMSENFALDYSSGEAEPSEFEGTITFIPIKDGGQITPPYEPGDNPPTQPEEPGHDPCEDETVITVGGSVGGGGSGGSSSPFDPNGNGAGIIEYTSGSYMDCFQWVRVMCDMGTPGHYGNVESCQASFQGATYLVNQCTDTITSIYGRNPVLADPCAPVGNIGVLFPILLNLSHVIVDEIIDTDLDDCSKGVLAELKVLSQVSIAAIISKLDAVPSVYKTTIKTESFGAPIPARTVRQAHPDGGFKRHDYIIRLNPDYVATGNKLALANTLLHEIIHAYFLSLVDDQATGSNPNALEAFPVLFEAYVTKTFGPGASVAQHVVMAEKYVDIMAKALQEFQTGDPVSEDEVPDQIYIDLAWGGLQDAPVFLTLPETDRNRIINRYAAEWLNQTRGGQVPIGNPCD